MLCLEYIDLAKLMLYTRKHKMRGVEVLGVITGAVKHAPHGVAKECESDSGFWARVQVYAIHFNRGLLQSDLYENSRWVTHELSDWYYLRGNIVVYIDKVFYGKVTELSCNGTLYLESGKNSSYYMANWIKVNKDSGGINSWALNTIEFKQKTLIPYPSFELKAGFENCYSLTEHTMNWHKPFDESFSICGVENSSKIESTNKKSDASSSTALPEVTDLGRVLNDYVVQHSDLGVKTANASSTSESDVETIKCNKSVEHAFMSKVSEIEAAKTHVGRRIVPGTSGVRNNDALDNFYTICTDADAKLDSACSDFSVGECTSLSNVHFVKNTVAELSPEMQTRVNKLKQSILLNWSHEPYGGLGVSGARLMSLEIQLIAKRVGIFTDLSIALGLSKSFIQCICIPRGNSVLIHDLFGDDETCKTIANSMVDAGVMTYFDLVGILLNLPDDISSCYAILQGFSINATELITHNPYLLCTKCNTIHMQSMDSLAFLYGMKAKERDKFRSIAQLHCDLTNSTSDLLSGSTCIQKDVLVHNEILGYTLGGGALKSLKNTCNYFGKESLANIRTYLNPDYKDSTSRLQNGKFVRASGGSECFTNDIDINTVLKDYIDYGLGVAFTVNGVEYIEDTQIMKKEMYISGSLLSRVIADTSITDVVDKAIVTQGVKGTITHELSKALHIACENMISVISLPSSCAVGFIKVLQDTIVGANLCGLTPSVYATSQGVRGKIQIIPKFAVNSLTAIYPSDLEDNMSLEEIIVRSHEYRSNYYFDSISGTMIVYNVCDMSLSDICAFISGISGVAHIIFVGDVNSETLDGKPFVTLFKYLPYSVLSYEDFSKKCILDKGVTNLSSIQYSKFKSAEAVSVASRIVASYTTKGADFPYDLSEKLIADNVKFDDIRLVSSVRNIQYCWGTEQLNHKCHSLFNPLSYNKKMVRQSFGKFNRLFAIGDTVVTLVDDISRLRFTCKSDVTGKCYKLCKASRGVKKNVTGTIRDIILGKDLHCTTLFGDDIAVKRDVNVGYIVVQYKGYNVFGKNDNDISSFYSLYYFEYSERTSTVFSSTSYFPFTLGYALLPQQLCNKQLKVVVCLLFDTEMTTVTSDMLHDIFNCTDCCYLLGNTDMHNVTSKWLESNTSYLKKDTLFDLLDD